MLEAYNPYLKFSMDSTNKNNTTVYRQAWSSHRVRHESDRSDANIGSDSSRRIWKFYAVHFHKAIKPVNILHTHYIIIKLVIILDCFTYCIVSGEGN